MDKELFWQIIERAEISKGNSVDGGIQLVQDVLRAYSPDEVIRFQVMYDTYKDAADRDLIMGLACLLMGCSDQEECADVFDYFLDILVFYGKDRYLKTLKDPDSFVETLRENQPEEYDMEALNCLAYALFADPFADRDFREFYGNAVLSDEEKESLLKEIAYSSCVDEEWKEIDDLEGLLPKVFNMCFAEE